MLNSKGRRLKECLPLHRARPVCSEFQMKSQQFEHLLTIRLGNSLSNCIDLFE